MDEMDTRQTFQLSYPRILKGRHLHAQESQQVKVGGEKGRFAAWSAKLWRLRTEHASVRSLRLSHRVATLCVEGSPHTWSEERAQARRHHHVDPAHMAPWARSGIEVL